MLLPVPLERWGEEAAMAAVEGSSLQPALPVVTGMDGLACRR